MTQQPPSRDWHGIHHEWSYGIQCFRWSGEEIVGPNLLPLATEMRSWLRQEGHLTMPPEAGDERYGGAFSNPYSFTGSVLSLVLARVVNSSAPGYSETDANPIDAELERIRLTSELMLYTARFCEVVIKQMLHCTQIPKRRFKSMALGMLLESACPSCKETNGMEPHTVSMVGTLAHPFHLCLEFDHCAMDHMALINSQRNDEAAHSSVQMPDFRTVGESMAHLASDCQDVLGRFAHMLEHLAKIEQHMLNDLEHKGAAIMVLKNNGLAAADCNFNLEPGRPVGQPQFARFVE